MSSCNSCAEREAKPYGSGPYQRADLCLGCYYDWFQDKARAEDRLQDAAQAAQAAQARPHSAQAGEPGATPVWHKGANVAIREKACDQCGELITIRRAANGKHYPADPGATTPHWRSCASKRRAADGKA